MEKYKKGTENQSFVEEGEGKEEKTVKEGKSQETGKKKKKRKKIKGESPKGHLDDGHIMQVLVHRCDRFRCPHPSKLASTLTTTHLAVKVSFVDAVSQAYLKKSNSKRPVISRYEKDVDVIQAVMSVPFVREGGGSTFIPIWEETILINESFNYVTHPDQRVLVFFELVELLSGTECLAWAFLQLVSADGGANWGRRVRLQLYKPGTMPTPQSVTSFNEGGKSVPLAYHWWTQTPPTQRPRLSCSLYVTLNKVKVTQEVKPSLRSMYPVQEEAPMNQSESRLNLLSQSNSTTKIIDQSSSSLENGSTSLVQIRVLGQPTRLPNQCCRVLSSGWMGCHLVMFSNQGGYLATACQEVSGYLIIVYEVPSFNPLIRLTGHLGLIYDFCWSVDDVILVSASADTSVRLWNINESSEIGHAYHPSFVYAAQLQPITNECLITCCYDGRIRLWSVKKGTNRMAEKNNSCVLLQEVTSGQGHVNCLCFHGGAGNDDDDLDYVSFVTGSSIGVVALWKLIGKNTNEEVEFVRDLQITETKATVIDCILPLRPHKLIVQARNNGVYCIDLRIDSVVTKMKGLSSLRVRLRGSVSGDGEMVVFGGEDGVVCVWKVTTGHLLHRYEHLGFLDAVNSAHFHPCRDVIALACHAPNQPVKIYQHNPDTHKASLSQDLTVDSTARDLLKAVTSSIEMVDKESVMKRELVKWKLESMSAAATAATDNPLYPGGASSQNQSYASDSSVDRPPLLSITNEDPNKLQLAYKPSWIHNSKLQLMIVVEEYQAQRSDELTLKSGDVINVLYKDTESWWLGQSASTYQQGFFPTNHVVPLKSVKKAVRRVSSFSGKVNGGFDGGGEKDGGIHGGKDGGKECGVELKGKEKEKKEAGKRSINDGRRRSLPKKVSFFDSITPEKDANTDVSKRRGSDNTPGLDTPAQANTGVIGNLKGYLASLGRVGGKDGEVEMEGGSGVEKKFRFGEKNMIRKASDDHDKNDWDDDDDDDDDDVITQKGKSIALPTLQEQPSSSSLQQPLSSSQLPSSSSQPPSAIRRTTSFISKDLTSGVLLSKDHYQDRRREVFGADPPPIQPRNQSNVKDANVSKNKNKNELNNKKTNNSSRDPIVSYKPPIAPMKSERSGSGSYLGKMGSK